MPKIELPAEILEQLSAIDENSLIVDSSGKWVGLFVPGAKLTPPPISQEEVQRRKNLQGKSVTTAELLDMLERS